MTKNSVGEVRLRRIIHRGEKAVALELRTPHDKEWGISVIYPTRQNEYGVDFISASIEMEINRDLDIGYTLVCCREHEWEKGDDALEASKPSKATKEEER